MSDAVPTSALQVRSLVTAEGGVEVYLQDVEVPEPRPDQVLVRVEAAPVNPSDLGLLLAGADPATLRSGGGGRAVLTADLPPGARRAAAARVGRPLAVGNEGSGTVASTGSSPDAEALAGRVVAVAGGGMYSQYRCVDAASCLVLPEGVTPAEGASAFVNPLTVLGMVDTMRRQGHTALLHTAAASNLGQMLVRVCAEEGIDLVNVVRSPAQAEILRGIGAVHVCNSSSDTFTSDLAVAVAATGATLAFDAVGGGDLASRVLAAMEAAASAGGDYSRYGSSVHKQVYLYGGLDRSPTVLTRSFGMSWGVGGWLLSNHLATLGSGEVEAMRRRVAAGITTTFASRYTDRVTLGQLLRPEVAAACAEQSTGHKHLVLPHGADRTPVR